MLFFKAQQLYFFFCAFDVVVHLSNKLYFKITANFLVLKYIVMFAARGPSRFAEEQLALKSSSP